MWEHLKGCSFSFFSLDPLNCDIFTSSLLYCTQLRSELIETHHFECHLFYLSISKLSPKLHTLNGLPFCNLTYFSTVIMSKTWFLSQPQFQIAHLLVFSISVNSNIINPVAQVIKSWVTLNQSVPHALPPIHLQDQHRAWNRKEGVSNTDP